MYYTRTIIDHDVLTKINQTYNSVGREAATSAMS